IVEILNADSYEILRLFPSSCLPSLGALFDRFMYHQSNRKKRASEYSKDPNYQSQNHALKAEWAGFGSLEPHSLFFLLRATGSCPENQSEQGRYYAIRFIE
ncbi:MAG TPA: hypothetical protein PKK68_09105, partial [Methanothrix soehngenii]|nr:hypothetical protein [Methanothrix soehngenii]